jgi:hypothetical protein
MADIPDNTHTKAKSEPTPPKMHTPSAKPVEVTGSIVVETKTFDPHQPILIDKAERLFHEQAVEIHGHKITNVRLKGLIHKIGTSVTYEFIGQVSR